MVRVPPRKPRSGLPSGLVVGKAHGSKGIIQGVPLQRKQPRNITPGLVLLTSGTVAAAAALSLVLTGYTAYRGLKFLLSGFVPVTDGVSLNMLMSTDGGGSYLAATYDFAAQLEQDNSATFQGDIGGSVAAISLSSSGLIGNGANEGINMEITMLNQTSGIFWPRVHYHGYFIDSTATPHGTYVQGGGAQETVMDVDAVQFKFSAGNIANGNYAVYGLA